MQAPPPPPPLPPTSMGGTTVLPPPPPLPIGEMHLSSPTPTPNFKKNNTTINLKSDNRDKLFDDIKNGRKLKKCVTIDKSAPKFNQSALNELSHADSCEVSTNGTTSTKSSVNNALQDELRNTLKRRKEGNSPIAKVPETPFVKRMQLANQALKIMKELEKDSKTTPDMAAPQINGKIDSLPKSKVETNGLNNSRTSNMIIEIKKTPMKNMKIETNGQNNSPIKNMKIETNEKNYSQIKNMNNDEKQVRKSPKGQNESKIIVSKIESKNMTIKPKFNENMIKTEKEPISQKEETQKLDKSRFKTFEEPKIETKSNLPPRKPMQQNNLKNTTNSPKILERTKIFEVKEESKIKIKSATLPKTIKSSEPSVIEPCRINRITESDSFKVFSNTSNEKENGKFISHGKPNFTINKRSNFSKDTTDGVTYKTKMSISFAQQLQDSPNKFPEVVKTAKQNVIKSDLIVDNVNLRDIKIDIDNSFKIVKAS